METQLLSENEYEIITLKRILPNEQLAEKVAIQYHKKKSAKTCSFARPLNYL